MNMNDLRAIAYGKKEKTGTIEDKDKKVQPFVPKTFIQTPKKSEAEKNVKPFTPQRIQSQKSENEERNIKPFVPGTFYKSAEKEQSEMKEAAERFTRTVNQFEVQKKKENKSKVLEDAANYLKKGGLIKIPDQKTSDGKDSVYRRVAKFLLLIGEDEAAKILPHLNEKQIEKIIPEIASIRTVNKDEASVILAEFNELLSQAKSSGGIETAREMLEKAYGKDKAQSMMDSVIQFDGEKPFSYLQDYDEERLYQLVKDENVGVQSMVLSYLQPEKAAKVINQMNNDEKRAVALRLAKMEPVSPEVVRRVSAAMHEKADNQVTEKAENIDGRNALAQILKKMDIGTESELLNGLSEEDPDLGEDLKQRLFTYEDVVNADDRFVQNELRKLSEVEIAFLIAGKSQDFEEKILSNISAGRRNEVRAQTDILKPMRKSEIDRITADFTARLRNAFEAGDLIIKDRNDENFV